MTFVHDTGGQPRSLNSRYCAVRALVIAGSLSWKDAEAHLRKHMKAGKTGHAALSRGVLKCDYDRALAELGFRWHPAPRFEGRKARCSDLAGRVIARQAGHYTAVIDGLVHDIWDCSGKMVYGYWTRDDGTAA